MWRTSQLSTSDLQNAFQRWASPKFFGEYVFFELNLVISGIKARILEKKVNEHCSMGFFLRIELHRFEVSIRMF
jgi:hypothetical protein